jgi:hypothetical protein
MEHPTRSDFDIAVTEAGVTVTIKPTLYASALSRWRKLRSALARNAGPSFHPKWSAIGESSQNGVY